MTAETLTNAIMFGCCIAYLKKAYRFDPRCNERLEAFERNATTPQIVMLYKTVVMLQKAG